MGISQPRCQRSQWYPVINGLRNSCSREAILDGRRVLALKNLDGSATYLSLAKGILMILPYDSLREAILQELSWAISIRRAQGVSFDTLEREYGLSKETLHLIVGYDDPNVDRNLKRATKAKPRRLANSRQIEQLD